MMKYAKAVVAAIIAGLTALLPALDDSAVSAKEWVVVAVATLGALGITYAVPNKAPQQ